MRALTDPERTRWKLALHAGLLAGHWIARRPEILEAARNRVGMRRSPEPGLRGIVNPCCSEELAGPGGITRPACEREQMRERA